MKQKEKYTMNRCFFNLVFSLLMIGGALSACSSDEEEYFDSIIGKWELCTLCYPEGNREIPSDDRDLFVFGSNGKVKVVIKKGKSLYPDLPNETGEYDYSYDKEKQTIQLCEKTLKCIISDGGMHLEGYHYGPDDGLYIHKFVFIKK